MMPSVSVIMPVRDGARWLGEAIGSVAGQTLAGWELLAIDDGSTDETPRILQDWSERDGRIRVLRQNPLGLVAALNRGIAAARGPLLARLDADDRAAPMRLERQSQVLKERPAVGLLGSWAARIDERGRSRGRLTPEIRPEALASILARANPFVHSSVVFRSELAHRLRGYRPAFEAAEDYDLWLRMSEVTQVANLPELLVHYRRHSANVTARRAIRASFSVRLAQCSARLRRESGSDPAGDLPAPPDWRAPAAASSFYAEEASRYRLLDLADEGTARAHAAEDADFAPLLAGFGGLNHAERHLVVPAMLNHARWASSEDGARTRRQLARLLLQRPKLALSAVRSAWAARSGAAKGRRSGAIAQ